MRRDLPFLVIFALAIGFLVGYSLRRPAKMVKVPVKFGISPDIVSEVVLLPEAEGQPHTPPFYPPTWKAVTLDDGRVRHVRQTRPGPNQHQSLPLPAARPHSP